MEYNEFTMDALTICAVNYLPYAHILGKSFIENNPNETFSILVIDSEKIEFDKLDKFNYYSPNDLDIPYRQFRNMSIYYSVTELSTALKPSAIKLMLKNGSKEVVYLDPDIQVFDHLNEISQALDSNPIVLTPHSLQPMPRDGLRPTESDILESGTFNLGFIAVNDSDTTKRFLGWWEERLQFDSIVNPTEMLFTDQRWIDLVPSYFPFEVIRHPGYNVAYWNLHERELTRENDKIFVNGQALKFFHFSGYVPDTPWKLSKYVSNNPRIVISSNSVLNSLCSAYRTQAVENGWASEQRVQYGFNNFGNRKNVPSSLRRLFREDCIRAFRKGEILSPPTDWVKWATQRSSESGRLSRILYSIWSSRPDLIQRFPDATGKDAGALVDWAKKYGVSQNVIDADLIHIGEYQDQLLPENISKKKGINVVGYLKGELGVGQSSRLLLNSAIATDYPVSSINYERLESRQNENYTVTNTEELYSFTISVINADQTRVWANDFGRSKIRKSKIIGVWAWETEDFPKSMHDSFEYVDEIWAVSNFVKAAISRHTKKQVLVFPTPVLSPTFAEKLDRTALGVDGDTKYNLFIFDYLSVFNRKNPLGLVEAHKKAFPDSNGPTLIIKSTNGDKDPENRELLRFSVRGRPDIKLIEGYLSREQIYALINECSAYISLHRSEGYGLTIAEAMSLGKPVIATAYSGNLDFMNEQNSFMIPYSLKKIGEASFPYMAESVWAEPDLEIASETMKLVFLNESSAISKGQQARQFILSEFTQSKAVEFIRNRVDFHFSVMGKVKFNYSRFAEKNKSNLRILLKGMKRTLRELKYTNG